MEKVEITIRENPDYRLPPELLSRICDAITENNSEQICSLSSNLHPADIAEFITLVSSDQRQSFLEAISSQFDPDILTYLEGSAKDEVLEFLGPEAAAKAIRKLDVDEAVQVMEDMEQLDQQDILEELPKIRRAKLEAGLAWPEDSAGRMMDTRFVAVARDWSVGQTIDFLRENKTLPDDFYSIFVLNEEQIPVGYALVSRVLRSERGVAVVDIMEASLKTIPATMDQEEVAYIFQKYALASAPVVDENNRVLGVIYIDDIVDVIREEAKEDILFLGGVTERNDINAPAKQTAYRRMPWLFINLITAIAASAVIAFFDQSIEQLVALAVLMPIVASMAGNAGTQTLTVAVRALATKDLTETNAWRVVGKEMFAASVNGAIFAVIVGVASYFVYHNLTLSFIFSAAMIISLIIAAAAGAIIPLWLSRAGADPAISSAVFLTTITDVMAFLSFLGLATWIMLAD